MRFIQIRRHSLTKKGDARGHGSHLSSKGVMLARSVGATLGTFDRVITSAVPRSLETAIALGYAVDRQYAELGDIPDDVLADLGHHERWTWAAPFVRFAELVQQAGPTARFGQAQQAIWQAALEAVPSQGRVLVISHGRIIETGLVTCLPTGDFATWGAPFQHLEGVELAYDQGRFALCRLLRRAS